MTFNRAKYGRHVLFAAATTLLPLSAHPLPPSTDSLSRSVAALSDVGFGGLHGVSTPAAPAAPAAVSRAAGTTEDAFAGLVALARAQPESAGSINETMRALGFDFTGDFLDRSLDMQPTPDAKHYFSIANLHGETVMIVEVYSRSSKELRSFRASASGTLQAAALTTKSNGAFTATPVSLPDPDASRVFAAEIDFWVRYYREHAGH